MRYVDSADKSQINTNCEKISYDKFGNNTEAEGRVFAQVVKSNKLDGSCTKKYYVLTLNNSIYDPRGVDSSREKSLNLILKPTNQSTFDFYIMYLQTKNSLYMTHAQRGYING